MKLKTLLIVRLLMKNKLKLIITFLIILMPIKVMAITSDYTDKVASITNTDIASGKINVYFFHGDGCPHCAAEEKWFATLNDKYGDDINIVSFEVWHNDTNAKYLDSVKKEFNYTANIVPYTVVGDSCFSGYSDTIASKIDNKIANYLAQDTSDQVTLPVLGSVNLQNVSLPIAAVILGLIDGFNPCAMWVLLFLINMLFKINNKEKRWILGLAFLFSSALIYFLSMLGINFVLGVATINYLKVILALFILGAGLFNLNKYFKIRHEVAGCTVVNDQKRKHLISKIKGIIDSKSFLIALLGIITLGISINLIELACSLGFPVIYTELLNLNNITGIVKIFYLLLYIVFYMLDDMVVFIISMVTLEATGITNKYNKLCTLISAIIMIIMGLLLLFKPEWLMLNF
jgi:thiol-disulfide isomerase/thioredoxin